jgi:hypothetical protein
VLHDVTCQMFVFGNARCRGHGDVLGGADCLEPAVLEIIRLTSPRLIPNQYGNHTSSTDAVPPTKLGKRP